MSDQAISDQVAKMPHRVFNQLFENLQTRRDGVLHISSQVQQWRFYWLDGQLLYVWGDQFAVRRFQRVARYYRPNWQWVVQPDWLEQDACWEISLIEQAIADRALSPIQLKLMLRMILQECSVALMHHKITDYQWQPISIDASSSYRSAALSEVEMRGVFRKSSHIYKNWQISCLRPFNLNDVPVLNEGAEVGSSSGLPKFVDGQSTIWDILLSQEPSMTKLASLLEPLIEDEIITFKSVQDLPPPVESQSVESQSKDEASLAGADSLAVSTDLSDSAAADVPITDFIVEPIISNSLGAEVGATAELLQEKTALTADTAQSAQTEKPASPEQPSSEPALIACIDDSPVLTLALKKILTKAGYRTLSIPEPMRGFSELIEHRPDLILLDLMLPNADGYSICKFLRETPVFVKTPIIILTGQDSKIDRMRAQLVGATDFLSKPPKADSLIELIEKSLSEKLL